MTFKQRKNNDYSLVNRYTVHHAGQNTKRDNHVTQVTQRRDGGMGLRPGCLAACLFVSRSKTFFRKDFFQFKVWLIKALGLHRRWLWRGKSGGR